jgi:predicted nucleotidyltransferase
MRTSPVIDVLLNRTRQRVLAATLLQPERRWYQLELAKQLGLRVSSLQRELKLLTEAGLLKRNQDGRRMYFQADTASPIFEDLARILVKTVGLADALKDVFKPMGERIVLAFVYGSVAASSERTGSDIDLMVIGDVALSELAPILRKVEPTLARPINPTVLTPAEFSRRATQRDHFLTTVLRNTSNESPGTRRSARRR